MEVENQEFRVLFSQLVENGKVMSHPSILQHQKPPTTKFNPKLDIMEQETEAETEGLESLSDPNAKLCHQHTLAPLASRAAELEKTLIRGPSTVSNITYDS